MDELLRHKDTEWLFHHLYKYNGKNLELSQQERREKFLEEQKQRRHQVTDKHRQICETFFKELDVTENMECDVVQPPTRKKIQFELMQSEWLTDIPNDLEENWFSKFCPQGFRILLVARSHITIGYNSQGRIVFKIKSNFPGGRGGSNGITVLDCIYNKPLKTVFVLDCLFWNSMSMLESEVTFRFFWLKTKFEENPALIRCLKYSFMLLDYVPAQRPLIQDHMFDLLQVGNQKLPYDGVVFYHKESHYIFGYTPLVGWLASYMLPEKLHIDVAPENTIKKPKDYVDMEHYLQTLRNNKKRSKEKLQEELESGMDVQ